MHVTSAERLHCTALHGTITFYFLFSNFVIFISQKVGVRTRHSGDFVGVVAFGVGITAAFPIACTSSFRHSCCYGAV